MRELLVLWDIDGTLLNSGGVGRDLYDVVFAQLFGRSLEALAPMAGRTDRSIILQTLTMAGVPEPQRYVDPFIAEMSAQAPRVRSALAARGQALPGAAAALAALASARSLAALTAPTAAAAGLSQAGASPADGSPGNGPSGNGSSGNGSPGSGSPAGEYPQIRVHQSVLTGNIRSVAKVKLAALGLHGLLDLCIGAYGDDHEVRSELVQVARQRAAAAHRRPVADFAGTSTVLVGDTPLDIEAALAAGARAVGVATGSFSRADLVSAGAHAVLPDLTDTAAVLHALLPDT